MLSFDWMQLSCCQLPVGVQANVVRKLGTLRLLCKARDLQQWGEADVGLWLDSMGLNEFNQTFADNDITGKWLLKLNDGELKVCTSVC
jgi:hypothetical protein